MQEHSNAVADVQGTALQAQLLSLQLLQIESQLACAANKHLLELLIDVDSSIKHASCGTRNTAHEIRCKHQLVG